MDLYRNLVRPILFRFEPETVHNIAVSLAARGLIKEHVKDYPELHQELIGAKFKNPLGLAAGFDKNAIALAHWQAAGFGFVEVGTVTHSPQAGNPKPRMFRIPEEKAIINRLGFNNEGAKAVAENLAAVRTELPYGINIGKSFSAPLEEAAEDYRKCFKLLHAYGNYLTVNVSSPNTPGLRTLQDKEKLREILTALREVDRTTPIFVKVAPDLEKSALDELVEVAIEENLAGLIATNTTIRRDMLTTEVHEGGGLSGKPLRDLADSVLEHLAKIAGKRLILIGVGGIFTGEDLFRKIALGAHLCQIYTGWVYGGPNMVAECLADLVLLMEQRGFKNIEQLRGSGLK